MRVPAQVRRAFFSIGNKDTGRLNIQTACIFIYSFSKVGVRDKKGALLKKHLPKGHFRCC